MLRLISKYDPSTQTDSPSLYSRRNSRTNIMVDQENIQSSSPIGNHNKKKGVAPEDQTNPDQLRQNVIVKNISQNDNGRKSPCPRISHSNQLTSVKSERLSPKLTSPLVYPTNSKANRARYRALEETVSKSTTSNQNKEGGDLNQVREKLQRSVESLSRFQSGELAALSALGFSPASIAAALFSQGAPGGANNIYSASRLVVPPYRGPALAQFRCLTVGSNNEAQGPLTQRNAYFPGSSLGTHHAESLCVNSKAPSATEKVSIRRPNGDMSSSEPLDLSQSRQESGSELEACYRNCDSLRDTDQPSMLVDDGKMKVSCELPIAKNTPASENSSLDEIRRKVKKEVLDEETENKVQANESQSTERLQGKTHTLLPSYLPFQQFVRDRNLREAVGPYGVSWLDLQGTTAIHPHAFLPHAAFGYLPAALGTSKTPLQALASLDPTNLALRTHTAGIAAGLTHWVNLCDVARAVERLRQSPMSSQNETPTTRKRKAQDDAPDRSGSAKAEEAASKSAINDTSKRIRLHESLSEGLQRSVSDDQGKTQQKDIEGNGKKLERRNSAPSSSVVSQMLRQEDQKRIAPVDLHSYTGCLPPHYLHLLQSSGNLPMTWREHALREVTDVYDRSHKVRACETDYRLQKDQNDVTSDEVRAKNRMTKERSAEAAVTSHEKRSEGNRLAEALQLSAKYTAKPVTDYKELWRPGILYEKEEVVRRLRVHGRPEGDFRATHNHLGVHFNPQDSILKESDRQSMIDYYQKVQLLTGVPKTDTFSEMDIQLTDKKRKSSETESDDEDYIQSLQISDASSDEDEESGRELKHNLSSNTQTQAMQNASNTSLVNDIDFGKGAWACMDHGELPAFGGITSKSTSEAMTSLGYSASTAALIPTKTAGTVNKKTAQPLNGFSRVYCASNIFMAGSRQAKSREALSNEFLPHDVVRGAETEVKSLDVRLIQTRCAGGNEKNKWRGCPRAEKKQITEIQDEGARKLISDILRRSFKSDQESGCLNTIPNCLPRLVFSSDVQAPGNLRPQGYVSFTAKSRSTERENIISRTKTPENRSVSQNDEPESEAYSHKLFNAARENRTVGSRNVQTMHDQSPSCGKDASKGSNVKTTVARDRHVSPLTSGPICSGARPRKYSSSSTSSSRLNSFNAKMEELRQKAEEKKEQRSNAQKLEINESRQANNVSQFNKTPSSRKNDREVLPVNVKTEQVPSAERNDMNASVSSPSRPAHQGLPTILDTRQRQRIVSPFQEEGRRFGAKKNVAIIKPNRSSAEVHRPRDTLSEYGCPPKKRHFKRYSPEIHNSTKRELSPRSREVRSASPVTRVPFVPGIALVNDDQPRNIRWGSPERSPSRRRQHESNQRTFLHNHVLHKQLKSFRESGGHTVMLEQNYRKSPRYVTSPRSDAVIVVQSRLPDRARDERDERLEIGDLEISDDES